MQAWKGANIRVFARKRRCRAWHRSVSRHWPGRRQAPVRCPRRHPSPAQEDRAGWPDRPTARRWLTTQSMPSRPGMTQTGPASVWGKISPVRLRLTIAAAPVRFRRKLPGRAAAEAVQPGSVKALQAIRMSMSGALAWPLPLLSGAPSRGRRGVAQVPRLRGRPNRGNAQAMRGIAGKAAFRGRCPVPPGQVIGPATGHRDTGPPPPQPRIGWPRIARAAVSR